jgi:hypothetical protein
MIGGIGRGLRITFLRAADLPDAKADHHGTGERDQRRGD